MSLYVHLVPGSAATTSRKQFELSDSRRLSAVIRIGSGLFRLASCLLALGTVQLPSAQAQAPTQQWMSIYSGTTPYSGGVTEKIELDSSGNVYVAGWVYNTAASRPYYLTVKYNSSGVQQWVTTYSGHTGNGGTVRDLKVDSSGNVYVTGVSNGASFSGNDVVTIKYNSSGTQQWATSYNGPGNGADDASGLQVDSSGNVYVAGSAYGGSSTLNDYFTVKYNSSGVQQWAATYNGTGNSNDSAAAIGIDSSGNVYVTGASQGSSNIDYATIKYNSTGTQQWVASYNGGYNGQDAARALYVDSSGNVYVTGTSEVGSLDNDILTVKYDTSGTQQWATGYGNVSGRHDLPSAITVDSSGNVYVAGNTTLFDYSLDILAVKYNSSGVQQWAATYDGPGGPYGGATVDGDWATSIAVDSSGNVYVGGIVEHQTVYQEMAILKYDSSGSQLWSIIYGSANSSTTAKAADIKVDSSGTVYATGYGYIPGVVQGAFTYKY